MTKDLIAELRDFHTLCGDTHCDHGEATESEHCAACQAEFPCSAIRAADALEARQPGENDREALVRVVANHPIAPLMRLGGDAGYPLADAILAAGFSRAAVPDAATEDMTVAEFCEALGFVDDSTTPAKLRDIVEPIQWWDSEARDHVECARICEQCGETLARTLCGECHGGGQRDGGNGTVRECGNCGGAGWLHEGCAEVAYADLVAERDAALEAIERVAALHVESDWKCGNPRHRNPETCCPECYTECETCDRTYPCDTRAALDGAPEPEEKP